MINWRNYGRKKSRDTVEMPDDAAEKAYRFIKIGIPLYILCVTVLPAIPSIGPMLGRLLLASTLFAVLAGLVCLAIGAYKGAKKEIVIFYDYADLLTGFMMVGGPLLALFVLVVIGWVLGIASTTFWGYIMFLAATAVFVYFFNRSWDSCCLHNRGEGINNLLFALAAKIGCGTLYPLAWIMRWNTQKIAHDRVAEAKTDLEYFKAKDLQDRAEATPYGLILGGIGIFVWLVNGKEVYKRRGWELTTNQAEDLA